MKYFEDVEIGAVLETATHTMDREEILGFAQAFDPQYFHTDEDAAKTSIYGGLIASGWHTAACVMRLLVDQFKGKTASVGSPGFDDLRWLKPVRPGDKIYARSVCIEKTPSRSKPNLGTVRMRTDVFNQKDELVMHMTSIVLYLRRPVKSTGG